MIATCVKGWVQEGPFPCKCEAEDNLSHVMCKMLKLKRILLLKGYCVQWFWGGVGAFA